MTLDNAIYIVKFSGGKDSTATLLKVLEEGVTPKYTIYQYVTGNTQPEVIHYLSSLVKLIEEEFGVDLNFQIIYSEDFLELMRRHHKPFPNPKTLWCPYWLKIIPLRKWLRKTLPGVPEEKIVFVIGVKRADSRKRAKTYTKKLIRANEVRTRFKGVALDNGKYWLYFPILDMTDEEVWNYLKQYPKIYDKVREAYKKFINPSSCIVCPFHNKEFYRNAPMNFLLHALEIIREIEVMPHIASFKIGYQAVQHQKKLILSAIESKAKQ